MCCVKPGFLQAECESTHMIDIKMLVGRNSKNYMHQIPCAA